VLIVMQSVSQRSPIDDKYETTGSFAVVWANDIRYSSLRTTQWARVRRRRWPRPSSSLNYSWSGFTNVSSSTTLAQNAAVGEELLNCVNYLVVDGSASSSSTDYDDVRLLANEIRAMSDGYTESISLLVPYIERINVPIAVSSLSPVATQILIPARFRSAMVSGTPSCRRSSIAVAPSSRRSCSSSSDTASIFASRSSIATVASWYRSLQALYSSSERYNVRQLHHKQDKRQKHTSKNLVSQSESA